MILRRFLAIFTIILTVLFAAIDSPAVIYFSTGKLVPLAGVTEGHFHPLLLRSLLGDQDNNFADIIAVERQENIYGTSSVGFRKIGMLAGSVLALCLLFWGILFLRSKERWYSLVAVLAESVNSKIARELYIAFKRREENRVAREQARRADKPGGTPDRRRKTRFNYTNFYNKAMNELALYSTCGPARAKNGKAAGNGLSHNVNGALSNEIINAGFIELLAGQKNLIREQKLLLEHQTKFIVRLPADAPLPHWQASDESLFYTGPGKPQ